MTPKPEPEPNIRYAAVDKNNTIVSQLSRTRRHPDQLIEHHSEYREGHRTARFRLVEEPEAKS